MKGTGGFFGIPLFFLQGPSPKPGLLFFGFHPDAGGYGLDRINFKGGAERKRLRTFADVTANAAICTKAGGITRGWRGTTRDINEWAPPG